jgi:hypothetical protein
MSGIEALGTRELEVKCRRNKCQAVVLEVTSHEHQFDIHGMMGRGYVAICTNPGICGVRAKPGQAVVVEEISNPWKTVGIGSLERGGSLAGSGCRSCLVTVREDTTSIT